jgi:hypothetical protein
LEQNLWRNKSRKCGVSSANHRWGYIIAGDAENPETGIDDGYLIKTDSSGNIQWNKTYGISENISFNSVKQTSDGGYITVGSGSVRDIYLIKTDTSGAFLWSKTFGGFRAAHASSIQETTDKGYIIVGGEISYSQDMDAYLIKTDSDGNMSWSKLFGDWGNEVGASVWQTTDGGYILVGNSDSFGAYYSECYLIKTDLNGYTGCYMNTPATIEDTASLIMANPATITTNPVFVTTIYVFNVGTGGTMINLCSTVGLEDVVYKYSFSISPNPASTTITISTPTTPNKNTFMTIKDITGKEVLKSKLTQEQNVVDVSGLSQGVYFVRVTDDRMVMVTKFIKSDK